MRISPGQTGALVLFGFSVLAGIAAQGPVASWDVANPVQPLPASPLGIDSKLTDLKIAP
jgi:hypothetical protein